eukprot:6173597-Pleurochrysis_carterae.AAC.1
MSDSTHTASLSDVDLSHTSGSRAASKQAHLAPATSKDVLSTNTIQENISRQGPSLLESSSSSLPQQRCHDGSVPSALHSSVGCSSISGLMPSSSQPITTSRSGRKIIRKLPWDASDSSGNSRSKAKLAATDAPLLQLPDATTASIAVPIQPIPSDLVKESQVAAAGSLHTDQSAEILPVTRDESAEVVPVSALPAQSVPALPAPVLTLPVPCVSAPAPTCVSLPTPAPALAPETMPESGVPEPTPAPAYTHAPMPKPAP